METRDKNIIIGTALSIFMLLLAQDAQAVTAPAAGSFAYDIYSIAVQDILKGPIGFVCGLGAVAYGSVLAIRQNIMGCVPALLGGGALLKADTIVTSLGCLF